MGIKERGRSGTSRDSNPACQCCSSAHLVQCEPDEASSFTNPNMGPGTYASLRLKLDAWSSAVQRGQKCSSPTRRLPSRSWGPIRPRVCSWFRAPIRHECQTAQLKSRERALRQERAVFILRPTNVRIWHKRTLARSAPFKRWKGLADISKVLWHTAPAAWIENKTNATSHPNIGLLKTNIEEEWNKISEEFILKACKSFRRHVDTIIEKNNVHFE